MVEVEEIEKRQRRREGEPVGEKQHPFAKMLGLVV
jgi:hypothetical protein